MAILWQQNPKKSKSGKIVAIILGNDRKKWQRKCKWAKDLRKPWETTGRNFPPCRGYHKATDLYQKRGFLQPWSRYGQDNTTSTVMKKQEMITSLMEAVDEANGVGKGHFITGDEKYLSSPKWS
jgi:hypothetical protein